jgi:hypothetical protein
MQEVYQLTAWLMSKTFKMKIGGLKRKCRFVGPNPVERGDHYFVVTDAERHRFQSVEEMTHTLNAIEREVPGENVLEVIKFLRRFPTQYSLGKTLLNIASIADGNTKLQRFENREDGVNTVEYPNRVYIRWFI